jgi:hypothetical protein
MKRFLLLFAALAAPALAVPQTIRLQDALAMRDAVAGVLKGHVVVTQGAKDQQPVVTVEPFDIGTPALIALGHDKRALSDAVQAYDDFRGLVQSQNGITGRADDSHESVVKANQQLTEWVAKHPTVSVDLEPISLDDLQLAKNKFDNDAVFGVLGPILKTK